MYCTAIHSQTLCCRYVGADMSCDTLRHTTVRTHMNTERQLETSPSSPPGLTSDLGTPFSLAVRGRPLTPMYSSFRRKGETPSLRNRAHFSKRANVSVTGEE